MSPARSQNWVECPRCGQMGNEPPGFRLTEFPTLEAVIVPVGEAGDAFPSFTGPDLPQKLECRSCGYTEAVKRGSITVLKRGG